jgi:hypothetical protein
MVKKTPSLYVEQKKPVSKAARFFAVLREIAKGLFFLFAVWAFFYFSQPYQRGDYVRGFESALKGEFALAGNIFKQAFRHNPVYKAFSAASKRYYRWINAGRKKLDSNW